jgi:hypothetical protein
VLVTLDLDFADTRQYPPDQHPACGCCGLHRRA